MTGAFEQARAIADAVLYEGYLLYPYRATAAKNQVRWQFGVLVPPAYASSDPSEHADAWTECVLDAPQTARLHVRVRFLRVCRRLVEDMHGQRVPSLECDGDEVHEWDEASEQEHDVLVTLADLLGGEHQTALELASEDTTEEVCDQWGQRRGRIVRRSEALSGRLTLKASRIPGPYGGIRLVARVENASRSQHLDATRESALRHSFIAAHLLLGVDTGAFLSLTDPPEWASHVVQDCENVRLWPVLLGAEQRSDALLAAPIILYDNPGIAPESPQQLFDGTEIDEILTLRTLALTEDEKQQARSTDPRARELMDGVDALPPELLERLHGSLRSLRPAASEKPSKPSVPWWDPGADSSVSPETDTVHIGGQEIGRGSKVRLQPGTRRADAQDMFLAGRTATVHGVFLDVDGEQYLAVTIDDDPASDLHGTHGRFRYFFTDEVEVVHSGRSDAGEVTS